MRLPPLLGVLALGTCLAAACGGSKPPAEGPKGEASGAPGGGGGAGGAGGGGATGDGAGGAASGGAGGGGGAGPAAPKPDAIDPAVPETKDAKAFARRQACEKPPCPSVIVPAGFDVSPEGKPVPVAMFEVALGRKVMWSLPKNANLTVYGVLLDGEISVYADDIKDKQKRCWKLDAFRAPGAGVNVFAKEPTRILVGVAATGDAKTVTDALQKPAPWAKRPSPVDAVELGKKAPATWGGGAYHARIGFEDANAPSLTLLLMSKNAPVDTHVHATEWELLAIVDGDGELTRKEGGNVKTTSGTLVAIPPGVSHGYRPAGTTPTLAVQMYSPSGPEQRFKKLAETK